MSTRNRQENLLYKHYLKKRNKPECVFCVIEPGNDQLIKKSTHFKVIKNIFPYSIWDGADVVHHIMITPIKHTDNLATLSDTAKLEFVKLLADYESQGYSFYGRTPSSQIKSIYHQHTHLIKIGPKQKRLIITSQKPFFRISF